MVIANRLSKGERSLTSLNRISSSCIWGAVILHSGAGAIGSSEEEDCTMIGAVLGPASREMTVGWLRGAFNVPVTCVKGLNEIIIKMLGTSVEECYTSAY